MERIRAKSDKAFMRWARCRDSDIDREIFFPEPGGGSVAEARKICDNECSVTAECLDYALRHRIEFGVWGGKSERERKRILRRGRAKKTA